MHRTSTVTPSTFLMELCPFVNFSMCPLNNFETLGDIFLKLGTNIKGHQMICRERLHKSTYSIKGILIMPPDLALSSTLTGSNYPCLQLILMVPKVFEPLKFYCILCKFHAAWPGQGFFLCTAEAIYGPLYQCKIP